MAVTSLTDAYTETFANPDGTYRIDMSAEPVRAENEDGDWAPIDTTLQFTPDGRVAPRNAATDLSFSGTGAGPTISIGVDAGQVDLTYPGKLPTPVLDGDSATYRDVMPGVDLVATATTTGYREVLVVKTPEAAQHADLSQFQMGYSATGLNVVSDHAGGVEVTDLSGAPVLSSARPMMWDSSGDTTRPDVAAVSPATAAQPDEAGEAAGVDMSQPGPGDDSQVMKAGVTANSVTVTPSQPMLTDSSTVFPVYIDPPLELSRVERIMVGSNGEHPYNFSGDEGIGRCDAACPRSGGAYIKRMYFEYSNDKLAGKRILDATFRAYETWSYSCTASDVRIYRASANISSSTTWGNQPSGADMLVDRTVSNGRGTACSPAQNDSWVEFNDSPSETDENLTNTVSNFANGSYGPHMTIQLRGGDESAANSWKRFRGDATLSVQYMFKPGTPTGVGIRTTTKPGSEECAKSPSAPSFIGFPKPTLTAVVHTQIKPVASDGATGSLRAEFVMDQQLKDGTWNQWWGPGLKQEPSSGTSPNGTSETTTPASNLPEDDLFRYRVRTVSSAISNATGDAVYMYSAFTAFCYFRVDTTGPATPIFDASSEIPPCDANSCPSPLYPGQTGHVRIHTPETNIDELDWQLDAGPVHAVRVAPSASGSAASIAILIPSGGEHIVRGWALETTANHDRSPVPADYRFKAALPPPATVWHVTETAGTTVKTIANDQGSSALNLALGSAAAIDPRGRRENAVDASNNPVADTSMIFNGTSASTATTGVAPLDASQPFTISAEAFLTSKTHNQVVLGQANTDSRSAGYAIRFNAALDRWELVWHYLASGAAAATEVVAAGPSGQPVLNGWTHLLGEADPATHTLSLYVDGRFVGSASGYTAESTTGPLTVATTHYAAGSNTDFLTGLVDEIHVWSNYLVQPDLLGDIADEKDDNTGQPALVLVGDWDSSRLSAGSITNGAGKYPGKSLIVNGAASTYDADGGLLLNGVDQSLSYSGLVANAAGSFTVATSASLDGLALSTKPAGYIARLAGQQRPGGDTSWALYYYKPTADAGEWVFSHTSADGTSSSVVKDDTATATTDAQVTVTGTYDAGHGATNLYVEQDEIGPSAGTTDFAPAQASGEFSIGRTPNGGTGADMLPGSWYFTRVWQGAMTPDQVGTLITPNQ